MKDRGNGKKIKILFLGVAGRRTKNYKLIANEIHKKIDKIITESEYSRTFEGPGQYEIDAESWYYWKGKMPIHVGQNKISCDVIIKHFKVRVIIEFEIETKETDLINLFKEARRLRTDLSENAFLKSDFFKKSKECEPGTWFTENVDALYWYPLIQIPMEYHLKDYDDLKDESITSFLYEVHDAKREGFLSQFFCPKFSLIRVSRPSIITTKISKFMQDEIINAIYDTWLHSLRQENTHTASDEIFGKMRNYIGKVLFTHEEAIANARLNRGVYFLSSLALFGVFASLLALIVAFDSSLSGIKSYFGAFLLVILLIIGIIMLISSCSFQKKCN
jgi:hypothetical protein